MKGLHPNYSTALKPQCLQHLFLDKAARLSALYMSKIQLQTCYKCLYATTVLYHKTWTG